MFLMLLLLQAGSAESWRQRGGWHSRSGGPPHAALCAPRDGNVCGDLLAAAAPGSFEFAETIWDDTTDTHAVLGWNKTQVVVAFRCADLPIEAPQSGIASLPGVGASLCGAPHHVVPTRCAVCFVC